MSNIKKEIWHIILYKHIIRNTLLKLPYKSIKYKTDKMGRIKNNDREVKIYNKI